MATSGLVVVDKSGGMTSHDVVARVRRIARTRRVGHAGTLDPMATGVLVVGVERATRLLGYLSSSTKRYTATIRLGQTTITEDAEGEVTASYDASSVTRDQVASAMAKFEGEIAQVPSAVSAIKVDGQRAYARVRAGQQVSLKPRLVTISQCELLAIRGLGTPLVDCDVTVTCSAGTYVRALARDVGEAVRVGGHLTALRRTQVGPFDITEASSLDTLAAIEHPISISLTEAVSTVFPRREVSSADAQRLRNGIPLSPVGMSGIYGVFDPTSEAIALVTEESGVARSLVVFPVETIRSKE